MGPPNSCPAARNPRVPDFAHDATWHVGAAAPGFYSAPPLLALLPRAFCCTALPLAGRHRAVRNCPPLPPIFVPCAIFGRRSTFGCYKVFPSGGAPAQQLRMACLTAADATHANCFWASPVLILVSQGFKWVFNQPTFLCKIHHHIEGPPGVPCFGFGFAFWLWRPRQVKPGGQLRVTAHP